MVPVLNLRTGNEAVPKCSVYLLLFITLHTGQSPYSQLFQMLHAPVRILVDCIFSLYWLLAAISCALCILDTIKNNLFLFFHKRRVLS